MNTTTRRLLWVAGPVLLGGAAVAFLLLRPAANASNAATATTAPAGPAAPAAQQPDQSEIFLDATPYDPPLRAVGTLVDGKPDGEWRSFTRTGKLYRVDHYRNGKQDGPTRILYPDGRTYSDATFRDGVLLGTVTYYENGAVFSKLRCANGQPASFTSFYPDGTTKCVDTSTMVDGQPHGQRFHYLADGTRFGITTFDHGAQVDQRVLREITRAESDGMRVVLDRPNAAKAFWPELREPADAPAPGAASLRGQLADAEQQLARLDAERQAAQKQYAVARALVAKNAGGTGALSAASERKMHADVAYQTQLRLVQDLRRQLQQ